MGRSNRGGNRSSTYALTASISARSNWSGADTRKLAGTHGNRVRGVSLTCCQRRRCRIRNRRVGDFAVRKIQRDEERHFSLAQKEDVILEARALHHLLLDPVPLPGEPVDVLHKGWLAGFELQGANREVSDFLLPVRRHFGRGIHLEQPALKLDPLSARAENHTILVHHDIQRNERRTAPGVTLRRGSW